MRIFFELGWFFRQYWLRYAGAISALIIISLLILIPPWLTGKVVDAIKGGSLTAPQLSQWVMEIFVVGLLTYLLRYIWRTLLYGAAYQLGFILRQKIYHHLTRMTPEFFQHYNTGDLMARATNDITAVEMTAGEGVLSMFDGALTGIVVLFALSVFINWQLTLLALIPWPFMGYFLWRVGNQLHDAFALAQASFSELNDRTQESIAAIRLIKAFGQQKQVLQQFTQVAQRTTDANQIVASVDAKYDPAILLTVGSAFFLTVAGGAWFIHQKIMTLGELTTFTMYLGYLIWPIFAFGWMLNILERGNASYTRIKELLASESGTKDNGQLDHACSLEISAHIKQFYYPGTQVTVLRDIHFDVPQATTLGIVGKVGSGKSTLIHLLARLYDANDIDICLGGHSLSDYTQHCLRELIAVVPQDPFLFSATVAENIALGKPDASLEEIENVSRIACVHEDILRFNQGYQTMVGERGLTLSGGQKQRIAIARALLRNAPVLILDDALSAVDVETETNILGFIKQYRSSSTNIIISHRLSAVAHAEKIIVLEQGKIIEQGNHQQLLANNGWYAQMVQYQKIERAVDEGR